MKTTTGGTTLPMSSDDLDGPATFDAATRSPAGVAERSLVSSGGALMRGPPEGVGDASAEFGEPLARTATRLWG